MKSILAAVFYLVYILSPLNQGYVYAQQCDQKKLDQSQSDFVAMLEEKQKNPDNISFSESDYQNAAVDFVQLSELCYHSLSGAADVLMTASQPIKIDDGALIPVLPESPLIAPLVTGPSNFTLFPNENKWGASDMLGTPGGTVSYSFMNTGVSIYDNGEPSVNQSITSLATYQTCFTAEIIAAFAAWSAVSNIDFVEVVDNGLSTNNPAANGLIRIGAHSFDGSSGTLAHAWAPLLQSQHFLFPDAGDIHFDTAENWTCDASGFDIGVVALHEIGHSIGLAHSEIVAAIMYPFYNPGLTVLQSDDIAGAVTLYGTNVIVQPELIFIKYGDYPVPILKITE